MPSPLRHSVRHLLAAVALLAASAGPGAAAPLSADTKDTLQRISANSLRGHLSFIASDLLEGRASPSRGLDLAAEYIAAQYRRAGLEPLGDDGYFQTANWSLAAPNLDGFALSLRTGADGLTLTPRQVSFGVVPALAAEHAGLVKFKAQDVAALEAMGAAVAGKVLLTELPNQPPHSQAEYAEMKRTQAALMARLEALKPLLLLTLDRSKPLGDAGGKGRLSDPDMPAEPVGGLPRITIHGAEAARLFDAMADGANGSAAIHLAASRVQAVKLRNVAGLLRGSDPKLKDTYVLVTAHYDHLGTNPLIESGDNIYNGANDDGSGTVSVVEIGSAMAAMKTRPKRSVIFMTVFGEERGLLGSRYYGRHPLVPIAQTVADINLEQIGRTDSSEGPQLNNASMTGFDFSDLGAVFAQAGKQTGITLYKHAQNSDRYFAQSDNQALADQGVPAHTLCVAFEYPDYHGLDDHWQKVDYDNMAKVDRMVALGVIMIANNPVAPRWNAANPLTAPYVQAWNKLRH